MCTQFGLVLITHRVPYRSHFFYFFSKFPFVCRTFFLICRFPSDKAIRCRDYEIKFWRDPQQISVLDLRKIIYCSVRQVDPKVSQIGICDPICIIGGSKGALGSRPPSRSNYCHFLEGGLISAFGTSTLPPTPVWENLGSQLFHRGSHSDWETWKNGKTFSSQGKVREFRTDWKSQGKSHKILESSGNFR